MKKNQIITIAAAFALIAGSVTIPVFAQGGRPGLGANVGISVTTSPSGTGIRAGVHATVSANVLDLISRAKGRADQEITRRIEALTRLQARVNEMTQLSATAKAQLLATIQAQITEMTNLQAQIGADASANSTTSLKSDIKSIAKSYRIFALVMPQGAIQAAADRITNVAGMMTTLAGKLQTRLADAQNSGANVSSSLSVLADMNAKIADANAKAAAAISEVSGLQPDNGSTTVLHANTSALQDARSKIVAAQHDLNTARQDAQKIIVALIHLGTGVEASSTVSASTSASSSSQ